MSLYIKTEDFRKYGISKYSDLNLVREAVEKDLNISPAYVRFVNRHKFIRVDFLKPRRPPRSKRRRQQKSAGRSANQG
jgi:hypothetical protein